MMPYKDTRPQIDESAFIAQNAVIIGAVTIAAQASIWFGCTLRGDVNDIRIGPRTNIQDHTVIHVSSTGQGTYVGAGVTVGHGAILHACTIGDGAFIGMQACIMDDAMVEPGAMIAAGALLTPGKVAGAGQLWGGSPARLMRDMTAAERDFLVHSADRYVSLSRSYL